MGPAPQDEHEGLAALIGAQVASTSEPEVTYTPTRVLGAGAMAVTLLALRSSPTGDASVVLKIVRPSILEASGDRAWLSAEKEIVALRRLADRVPSTPYVVRLIDAGELSAAGAERLPWMALELVHGGADGTTLAQRVATSVRQLGAAFDVQRAARAIACVAAGLDAVHEVGVVHRDITPSNVLVCGRLPDEMFKIVDFGLARPVGMSRTFHGGFVGTPGYAAPEQSSPEPGKVGPASDVFAMAAVVYFVLTGEHYFQPADQFEAMVIASRPERRSLLDAPRLSPELRAREPAALAVDAILAQATSSRYGARPRAAGDLAAMLLPQLAAALERVSRRVLVSLPDVEVDAEAETEQRGWTWVRRARAVPQCAVRSVAWDADGRAMAATSRGALYWSGTRWAEASVPGMPRDGARFALRTAAATWLVGGDSCAVSACSPTGVREAFRYPDPLVRFEHAAGSLEVGLVFVGWGLARSPTIYAYRDGAWLEPLPLPGVEAVTLLAAAAGRFVLAGRRRDRSSVVLSYAHGARETKTVALPPVRAMLAAASSARRGDALMVGTDGVSLHVDGVIEAPEFTGPRVDLSAAAMDPSGWVWAAGGGELHLRRPGRGAGWARQPLERPLEAPVVSLFAAPGSVVLVGADGSIQEGLSVASRA
ncbi:MAG: serine/threonine protein kinase [Polyangiaceae bacterium]|nr:serine/threonine protein kinase [Polyangiaceae bacterium]